MSERMARYCDGAGPEPDKTPCDYLAEDTCIRCGADLCSLHGKAAWATIAYGVPPSVTATVDAHFCVGCAPPPGAHVTERVKEALRQAMLALWDGAA